MTFQKGLLAAHDYLVGTAQDFKQSADRLNSQYMRSPREMKDAESFIEKYQLLLGQAEHIMKLSPSVKRRRPF